MKITESKVYAISFLILIGIAAICLFKGQPLGAIGSALGAFHALAARSFLLELKPQSAIE